MYIDAHYDSKKEEINVVERVNGKRVFKTYPPNYTFYYVDPDGGYTSLFGDKLSQFTCNSKAKFNAELHASSSKVFESDVNPVFRCLADNYTNADIPKMNVCFFDIEVDFDPEHGYSSIDNPFNKITAISLYLSHLDSCICLAIPPKTLTMDQALDEVEGIDNVFLFKTEGEVLDTFLDLIEDSDMLSGWNSAGFDIPYIVQRIELILGKEYSRKMCLWGMLPRKKKFVKFNKENLTYELFGRVHLDYLDLYQKHSMGELHSYRLDYVGEIEVGENKVPYAGTLDQLYNNDFRKFIEYSIQDTMLLKKIDDKKKYLDLALSIAHTNTVQIPTTQGSVALIEQAIINEAHQMGFIVQKKTVRVGEDEEKSITDAVAGAYVVDPKRGLHEWIGSTDINSLYPSVIRTFNMSPETLIGQLRPTLTEPYILDVMKPLPGKKKGKSGTEAWGTLFATLEFTEIENKSDTMLIVDFEDGKSFELPAHQIYSMIYDNGMPWTLTANGTIFRNDTVGVIPHLLTRWYTERQVMQRRAKTFQKVVSEGIKLDDDLIALLG